MNKYDEGICRWQDCTEPQGVSRDDLGKAYEDETWVLPYYCKKHGLIAVARRKRKIRQIVGKRV